MKLFDYAGMYLVRKAKEPLQDELRSREIDLTTNHARRRANASDLYT